jgi:hypothetical protein
MLERVESKVEDSPDGKVIDDQTMQKGGATKIAEVSSNVLRAIKATPAQEAKVKRGAFGQHLAAEQAKDPEETDETPSGLIVDSKLNQDAHMTAASVTNQVLEAAEATDDQIKRLAQDAELNKLVIAERAKSKSGKNKAAKAPQFENAA